MKALVWFNGTLEQSGGGERLSLEVVRCLKEQGYDANYVVYSYDCEATFGGKYDFLHPVSMGWKPGNASGALNRITKHIHRLIWLRKTIMSLNPDCVITSGTWNQVMELYLAMLFTGIPFVTHVFGSMFAFGPDKESIKFGRVFRKNFMQVRNSMKSYQEVVPERMPAKGLLATFSLNLRAYVKYHAIRTSKALFVLSERNRWENQMLYGQDSFVLQGAFPARIFEYRSRRSLKQDLGLANNKVILSIGRLAANKRVDLAILSFAEILSKKPETHFVIGGTGPEGEKLKCLADELGVGNKVSFIGYVPEAILWDYLADCDVFLHLDLADFDIAPLEALAMGANVVWSEEMDLPDLTRQLTCLWPVKPESKAIAEAVKQAIDAGKGAMLQDARRRVLQAYSWESYTTRMTQVIELTSVGDR